MPHYVDPRNDRIHTPLHVISAITNPMRYASRYRLYEEFQAFINRSGAILYTIEAAIGERDFAVTEASNPCHVQLRTNHAIWHKENLINLATSRLPSDWRYMAWVDADVLFARPDWVDATLHELQLHPVAQMWSESIDLGPHHETLGGAWSYAHGLSQGKTPPAADYYYTRPRRGRPMWHPGYAWAWRRDAFDHLGGLIDWSILGSADMLMARALSGGLTPETNPVYLGDNGVRWLMQWQERAERYIRRNIGCVNGLLLHYFHGSKRNRRYANRAKILAAAGFDPELDLKRDAQGLWQLEARSNELRDGIKAYFRSRDEDSTEV